jgi:transposase-like protein
MFGGWHADYPQRGVSGRGSLPQSKACVASDDKGLMATPQTAIRDDERYERLSDLYLRLWKQLDLICGDTKWLEVASVSQAELRAEAQTILNEISSRLAESASLIDAHVLEQDFKKTQALVEQANRQEGGLDSFRDYLRDLALRYSQLADES